MCKLYAVVEIENKKNAETFTSAALPLITKTDNHGLGIMRLGENGVHIQRWLEPPTVVRKHPSRVMMKYEKALKHEHNEEGKRSKKLHAIAVHGRFATCEKSLRNTHPFYRDGSALMHNGIISNSEKFDTPLSTCDSEALLTQYVEHKVKGNNVRLSEALKGVSGYYAAMVFNDNGVIDIWRDDTATLYLAHVRDVGVVIATTIEIIRGAARKTQAHIMGIDEIQPYTALRWTHGLSPQISAFKAEKPVTALTHYTPRTDYHSYGYTDPADKHWWEEELSEDVEAREWDAKTQKWVPTLKAGNDGSGYQPREWRKQSVSDAAPLDSATDDELEAEFLKRLQAGKE